MSPEAKIGTWHRTTFSEKILRDFSEDIPEAGKKALQILEERDSRLFFILNHLQANGSSYYFELDEEDNGPMVKLTKISYDFLPNADYGENPKFCHRLAFEPTLLIAALKTLRPGSNVEISGRGEYADPKMVSMTDVHLEVKMSPDSDRVIFSFKISGGIDFATIDAGRGSQEQIYEPHYDQEIEEFQKARSSN